MLIAPNFKPAKICDVNCRADALLVKAESTVRHPNVDPQYAEKFGGTRYWVDGVANWKHPLGEWGDECIYDGMIHLGEEVREVKIEVELRAQEQREDGSYDTFFRADGNPFSDVQ